MAILPFAAYIAVVPWVVLLAVIAGVFDPGLPHDSGVRFFENERARILTPLVTGYFVCIGSLLLIAVLATGYSQDKKPRRVALIFGAIGIVLLLLLWPMTFVPLTK